MNKIDFYHDLVESCHSSSELQKQKLCLNRYNHNRNNNSNQIKSDISDEHDLKPN